MTQSFNNYQFNGVSITRPVVLLDYDAYIAVTYKLNNLPRAIPLQSGTEAQFLALPYSKALVEALDAYYDPRKDFLVDPLKYVEHEKIILDSWLAEQWVYEEMLDKKARRSQ